jgi:transposase
MLKLLRQRGLKLYFLPPYSPELNRIEKLWQKMKYEWMAYKARDAHMLETDVEEVLTGFGKKYFFDLCR